MEKQDMFKFCSGCAAIAVLPLLILVILNIKTVDAGQVGVKVRNGRVIASMNEGIHFQTPFIDKIVRLNARNTKDEVTSSAASLDSQDVSAKIALNYTINRDQAENLYRNIGTKYQETVIDPKFQQAIKVATSKFTAQDLLLKRTELSNDIKAELQGKIDTKYFTIQDINIVNLEFSPAYTQAIEQKQVAQQNALKAENELQQTKIEAQKKVTEAQGESDANKLKQQSLTPELLQNKAIERWNGALPLYLAEGQNQSLPFINIKP